MQPETVQKAPVVVRETAIIKPGPTNSPKGMDHSSRADLSHSKVAGKRHANSSSPNPWTAGLSGKRWAILPPMLLPTAVHTSHAVKTSPVDNSLP